VLLEEQKGFDGAIYLTLVRILLSNFYFLLFSDLLARGQFFLSATRGVVFLGRSPSSLVQLFDKGVFRRNSPLKSVVHSHLHLNFACCLLDVCFPFLFFCLSNQFIYYTPKMAR